MSAKDDKIEIENFTSPGRTYRVDRVKIQMGNAGCAAGRAAPRNGSRA